MLESIFTGMAQGVASLLDMVISSILSMLNFDITSVLTYMPVIETFYDTFQWIALGLIAAIAIFQLGKFFFGNLSESKDTPIRILVRSAIASGLVYVGNYGIQLVLDLFSYPMAAMLAVDASVSNEIFTNIAGATLLAGLGGLMLSLILMGALGWNIFKLLLEAVERWLMLCVLTYTSLLAYATVASQATHEIFRKWFSMLIGQCILLLANVWSVKIILNILMHMIFSDPIQLLFCSIVALAFARIAQRIDSYLQQIGVNAATTGGSLLDTLAAVAGGLGGGKRGHTGVGGVAGKIMGAWGDNMAEAIKSGNVVKGAALGGGLGAAAAGVGKAIRKDANGMTAGDYVKSKATSAANGLYDKATAGMEKISPQRADEMRRTKDSLVAMATGGKAARQSAQEAGFAAAEQAIREGKTPEEAKQAGLNAFDSALKENAPLGKTTSGLFVNTSKNMDARDQFAKDIDPAIEKMQNGASRMYIDSNGVVHNGFGEAQSGATRTRTSGATTANATGATSKGAMDGATKGSEIPNPNDPLSGNQTNPAQEAFQNARNQADGGEETTDPNAEALRQAFQNNALENNDNPSVVSDTPAPSSTGENVGTDENNTNNPIPLEKETKSTDTMNSSDASSNNPYASATGAMEGRVMGTEDPLTSHPAVATKETNGTTGDGKPTDSASGNPAQNTQTGQKSANGASKETNPYATSAEMAGGRVMGAENPLTASHAATQENTPKTNGSPAEQSHTNKADDKTKAEVLNNPNPYADATNQNAGAMGADNPLDGNPTTQSVLHSNPEEENTENGSANSASNTAAENATKTASDAPETPSAPTSDDSSKDDSTSTTDSPIPPQNPYADAENQSAGGAMGEDNEVTNGSVIPTNIPDTSNEPNGSSDSTTNPSVVGSSPRDTSPVSDKGTSPSGAAVPNPYADTDPNQPGTGGAMGENSTVTNGSVIPTNVPAPSTATTTTANPSPSQPAQPQTPVSVGASGAASAGATSTTSTSTGSTTTTTTATVASGSSVTTVTATPTGNDAAENNSNNTTSHTTLNGDGGSSRPITTMEGPNLMISRAIASSANSQAAAAGTGFAEYERNPDPNAFDSAGVVQPGYEARVQTAGTQLAVNTINERGADVADSIIQSDYVVDNHSVAAAAFKTSSFAESMSNSDIGQSLSAMDDSGLIPAAREEDPAQGVPAIPDRGSITNMTVGKGVAEFNYEAPAQTKTVEGKTESVPSPVERVSVRTEQAFKSLPAQEQSLYHANRTSSGDTFYTKRVSVDPEHYPVASEHQLKPIEKHSSLGSSGKPSGSDKPSGGKTNGTSSSRGSKPSGSGKPKRGKGRK